MGISALKGLEFSSVSGSRKSGPHGVRGYRSPIGSFSFKRFIICLFFTPYTITLLLIIHLPVLFLDKFMKIFNRSINGTFTFLLLFLVCNVTTSAQITIDLEGGIVVTGYNDVRIPGDGGTFIGLGDELDSKPFIFERARVSYTFNERNTVSLLYAPLQLTYNGAFDRDVNFNNVNFPAATFVDATYKFNSYRFTYRYQVLTREKINLGVGITAKIRDAFIRLTGEDVRSEKTDLGFVPLINFDFNWQLGAYFYLLLEGDALAAPQGRAEDILLALGYSPNERIDIITGYRLLEGGADNDTVYTFSLFHFGVLGIRIYPFGL